MLKVGRTHWEDAVPITLGQEFEAWADSIAKDIKRILDSSDELKELGIGGTAIGTGITAHPKFHEIIVKRLNELTRLDLRTTKNMIELTQNYNSFVSFSSSLKMLAGTLFRISNNLGILNSGPKGGIKEVNLPDVEPGSSIMPGKINPSILEAVNMIAHRVMGNDTTLTISCASGNLELNTHMPIIANTLMESTDILTNGIKTLRERCISGIRANEERCRHYVEHSMALATALNPLIGYDKAAQVVKEARASKKTIKDVIISKGILTEQQVRRLLDPKSLTRPNLAKRQGG